MFKSGFISIIGRPNVGKSTLLNTLMGTKIAITSPKPQTTRDRITGIINDENYQMIFVDTPGIHKGKHLLGKTINKIATNSIGDVDVILFVVDRKLNDTNKEVLHQLQKTTLPVILVINKIDELLSKTHIDEIITSFLGSYNFKAIIPISAKDKTHISYLKEAILESLPQGPKYYPSDYTTDQSETTLIKELIREKILYQAEQEVPHSVAVVIESLTFNSEYNTYDISAIIICERPTQKQILIGKAGSKLKEIGTQARKEINKILKTKIHLSLWIKVKKDWRNDPNELKRYGYTDE